LVLAVFFILNLMPVACAEMVEQIMIRQNKILEIAGVYLAGMIRDVFIFG